MIKRKKKIARFSLLVIQPFDELQTSEDMRRLVNRGGKAWPLTAVHYRARECGNYSSAIRRPWLVSWLADADALHLPAVGQADEQTSCCRCRCGGGGGGLLLRKARANKREEERWKISHSWWWDPLYSCGPLTVLTGRSRFTFTIARFADYCSTHGKINIIIYLLLPMLPITF